LLKDLHYIPWIRHGVIMAIFLRLGIDHYQEKGGFSKIAEVEYEFYLYLRIPLPRRGEWG
jgi:hypothetical protein